MENQDENEKLFNIGRFQRNEFFEGSDERGFLVECDER